MGMKNPAELMNLEKKNEMIASNMSFQFSNNKVSSQDIFDQVNLEKKLFDANEPINMSVGMQLTSLGYAKKFKRFAVSLSSSSYTNLNLENINPELGDALINKGGNVFSILPGTIDARELQQINLMAYTDIAGGFALRLLNFKKHKLNIGFNAKLLFPSTFLNVGLENLSANLIPISQQVNALTATGTINFTYSGKTGFGVENINPLSAMSFTKLKGYNFDFGFNYQFYRGKDSLAKDPNAYLVSVGGVLSNMGKLFFSGDNTFQGAYNLNIAPDAMNPNGLDLNALGDVSQVDNIQNYLNVNNFITSGLSKNEFEIKLPLLLNLYTDVRITKFLYTSIYWQKTVQTTIRLNEIKTPDYITFTPRFVIKKFEIFVPISGNSVANPAIGAGLKIGKMYFASSSLLSFAFNSTKQIDFSFGLSHNF